jgi:hypothetical protein
MVDIQTVSIAVASASVVVGVIYYVWQIRHQTRMRKTDMVMKLYLNGTNTESIDAFWKVNGLQVKDYQDYVKQYGKVSETDNPMNRAFFTTATFYEMVGVLLYRKLIDLVTVYDVWGSTNPIMLFEKIKPIVINVRRELNEPAMFLGFEYLCAELKRNEPQLKKTLKEAFVKTSSQTS